MSDMKLASRRVPWKAAIFNVLVPGLGHDLLAVDNCYLRISSKVVSAARSRCGPGLFTELVVGKPTPTKIASGFDS